MNRIFHNPEDRDSAGGQKLTVAQLYGNLSSREYLIATHGFSEGHRYGWDHATYPESYDEFIKGIDVMAGVNAQQTVAPDAQGEREFLKHIFDIAYLAIYKKTIEEKHSALDQITIEIPEWLQSQPQSPEMKNFCTGPRSYKDLYEEKLGEVERLSKLVDSLQSPDTSGVSKEDHFTNWILSTSVKSEYKQVFIVLYREYLASLPSPSVEPGEAQQVTGLGPLSNTVKKRIEHIWKTTNPFSVGNLTESYNSIMETLAENGRIATTTSIPKGGEDAEVHGAIKSARYIPAGEANLETFHAAQRKLIREAHKEIENLIRWKREQIATTPDWQAIGKELDLPLGSQIHDKVLPGIVALKARIRSLELSTNKEQGK